VFVIGGSSIYELFLKETDLDVKPKNLYITEITEITLDLKNNKENYIYFPSSLLTEKYNLVYYSQEYCYTNYNSILLFTINVTTNFVI
jgi:hypothetical protein